MVLRIKEEGSRYKMRELLVDTCTGEEEDGTAHSFQYYILVDEMELGGGLSCESYGVKVAGAGRRGGIGAQHHGQRGAH